MSGWLWVAVLPLTGCGSLVMKLHPFHVTPPQVDVLWVQRGADVYRCANSATGPICLLAPFATSGDAAGALAPEVPPRPRPRKMPIIDEPPVN